MRRRSAWRAALVLGAPLVWLAVIVLARAGVAGPARLLAPLTGFLGSVVQWVVGWTGIAALRDGATLYVPGAFGYEISVGCTGLLPAAVLAVALLASPGSRAAKRRGLLLGVPAILALNVVRLAHLFYLGIHAPRMFPLAHSVLWEGAMVAFTFATWLAWSRWAAQGPPAPASAAVGETAQQLDQWLELGGDRGVHRADRAALVNHDVLEQVGTAARRQVLGPQPPEIGAVQQGAELRQRVGAELEVRYGRPAGEVDRAVAQHHEPVFPARDAAGPSILDEGGSLRIHRGASQD